MIHIISPHIDDAVFSVGGGMLKLAKANRNFKVHYVFTISSWINPNAICPIPNKKDELFVTEARKFEEKAVSDRLGYEYFTYDFKDTSIGDPNEKKYRLLINDVKSKICKLVSKSMDTILFPVGLVHPHHIAIREIGVSMSLSGYAVSFYEDMPYVSSGRYNYQTLYSEISRRGYRVECLSIDVEEKLSICRLYSSQVCNQWLKGIKQYAYSLVDNMYYERIWKPKEIDFDMSEMF